MRITKYLLHKTLLLACQLQAFKTDLTAMIGFSDSFIRVICFKRSAVTLITQRRSYYYRIEISFKVLLHLTQVLTLTCIIVTANKGKHIMYYTAT